MKRLVKAIIVGILVSIMFTSCDYFNQNIQEIIVQSIEQHQHETEPHEISDTETPESEKPGDPDTPHTSDRI